MANEISSLRKFVALEIIIGAGARLLAAQYTENFGGKKVLLISDPGVQKAGWLGEIEKSLSEAGINYSLYTNVSPNPREEEVMTGAELYQSDLCDTILCIGGGSAMDLAKGVGIVSTNGGHILDYEGIDKINAPVPPMIFIPTTAGSSADVSQFAIINNQSERVKIAIISKMIVPDVALIDPLTTLTMDPFLTACTGVDALVHAIEAFVSRASSPITDIHAIEAIRLLTKNLPQAVAEPSNEQVREIIMRASMEAGLAFSNAILGAVHAMSHSLGGYLDLPHGECNAILLDDIVDFNFFETPEKFIVIAKNMDVETKNRTGSEIKKDLLQRITRLKEDVGITHRLEKVGVNISDIPILAKKALNDACLLTNPRKANKRDLEVIYEQAL